MTFPSATAMTQTLPPASTIVAEQFLESGDGGPATAYTCVAVVRDAAEGPEVVVRVACLSCGASVQHVATQDETASSEAAEDAAQRYAEAFADEHDAAGCLDTFAHGAHERIGEAIIAAVMSHIGQAGDAFLTAIERAAATTDRQVAIAGAARGAEAFDTTEAVVALDTLRSHRHLENHAAQMAAFRGRTGADQPIAAVTLPGLPLPAGARRWHLLLPNRVLPFETRPAADGRLEIRLPVDDYTAEGVEGTFPIGAHHVLVSTALGVV